MSGTSAPKPKRGRLDGVEPGGSRAYSADGALDTQLDEPGPGTVHRSLTPWARAMRGKCPNCRTEQELAKDPPRVVLHALPQLATPVEIEVSHRCMNCGREVGGSFQFAATNKKVVLPPAMEGQPAAQRRHGHVWGPRRHNDYVSELSRCLEPWPECAVSRTRGQAERRSCHRSLRRSGPHGGVRRAVPEAVLGRSFRKGDCPRR